MSQMCVVYVLTNPAMPGLVKIGFTNRDDANRRIAELYSTGVPVPFTLEFACRVPNAEEVERALHIAFAPHRINPKREFFRIEADQAIAILRLLHTEDATSSVAHQPVEVDRQSLEAADQLKSRRPNLDFVEMGIPIGDVIDSALGNITVTVVTSKKVKLGEEELSLTAATRKVLGIDYSVQPTPHWLYKGRSLRELYDVTYGSVAE